MTACVHMNFEAIAITHRLTRSEADETVVGYTVEVRLACHDCGEPFVFLGLPVGSSPSEPAGSFDGTEARLPVRPRSAPDEFGRGLPGFSITEVRS